jgi:hypothetical protein
VVPHRHAADHDRGDRSGALGLIVAHIASASNAAGGQRADRRLFGRQADIWEVTKVNVGTSVS